MADLTKTVDVVLNGEDRLSSQFRMATQTARKFRGVLGGAGVAGGVVAAAGAATAAVAGLSAVLSGKLAQGMAAAYGEFATFESSLKDLEKVLGDHPEQLDEAKNAAQDMAVKYGVASEKIVDSMANWVQAGYDLDESMTLAEDAISLTYASELNMQEATKTMTRVMKGFGVEVDEARRKLDSINSVSNNYAASAGQLSEALGRVAPVAESMGFSMEEIAAVMTPAIEKFQDGRRVGTAFKTTLTKLQSDTKRVQEAMETLGVKQKDANGQFRSGKEILSDVAKNFGELDQSQQAYIATQIAGREHAAKLLATLTSYDQVQNTYNTQMQAAGSITDEVKNRLEAASIQMDRLGAAGKVLAQTIGGKVAESFTDVVGSATDLAGALQDVIQDGGASEFFESINEMAEDLAEWLGKVADAMPEAFEDVDFSGLAENARKAGESFKFWFDGLDPTKPDDLAKAIQKLADTMGGVLGVFEKTNTAMEGTWDGIRLVHNAIQTFMSFLGQEVLHPINGFVQALAAIPGTGEKVEEAAKHLQDTMDEYSDRIEKNAKQTKEAWRDLTNATDEAQKSQADYRAEIERTYRSAEDGEKKVMGFGEAIRSIKEGKHHVELDAKANKDSAKEAGKTAQEKAQEAAKEKVRIKAEAEVNEKKIEKEIAKIESQAETAQEALEMEAKVQVAQAEAQMERYKSSIESVTSSLNASTDALGQLFGEWSGDAGFQKQWAIQDAIEQNMELQERPREQQRKLINKQIELMEARKDAMESGEGLIKIDSEGLEPSLEMLLWEVLEKVQIRASEEASNFLLGING